MDALNHIHRAILDALDKCEHGTGDTEIGATFQPAIADHVLLAALMDLADANLVAFRFAGDDLRDLASTADPLIWSITNEGCEALWALAHAEATKTKPLYAYQVAFLSRDAMRLFAGGKA